MNKIKKFGMKFLFLLTGNKFAQFILEKFFYVTHLLLGIGSASFPISSGEKRIFDFLKNQNNSDQQPLTIFDVGANTGQFTELVLDQLAGMTFRIFCFEPVQSAVSSLRKKYSQRKDIIIEAFGLDDSIHQSEIYYDYPGSLRASKFQRDLQHLHVQFSDSEVVRFTTVDQYCITNGIAHIDLLKIDVEGNELGVLNGAKAMLNQKAIKYISFEFGRAQIDVDNYFKDYYKFLSGFGVKELFRILPNGFLKQIKNYDEKHEMFFTTNYLAVMY